MRDTLLEQHPVSEHGAVSVGSPSQAAAEGALLQLRNLNFLPLDEEGLHSDHSPHSAQVPAAPVEKMLKEEIYNLCQTMESCRTRVLRSWVWTFASQKFVHQK